MEFIIKTSENYFRVTNLETDKTAMDAFEEFMHNPHVNLLQTYIESGNKMCANTSVKKVNKNSMIFIKSSPEMLDKGGAICNVNIITLADAPEESLYLILKQVFTPVLSHDNDLTYNNIHQNLADLESNMRLITHKHSLKNNLNVILSIDDEVDYWKTLTQGKNIKNKDEEAAAGFIDLFQEIKQEVKSLEANSMSENKEVVENIGGILDDVWRVHEYPYPEPRMKHLFDVIGFEIITFIQKSLTGESIWQVNGDSKDFEILLLLSDSENVVKTWVKSCQSLTGTYWPNYALHPWTGQPYAPKASLALLTRVSEVLKVRSAHHQLNKLLTQNERIDLKTSEMFEPFKSINIWSCTTANQAWESAVAKFSANFRNAENIVAEKLKPRLHNTSTKQMLYEFTRYKSLINRPVVKRALNSELEVFVSSLTSLVKNVQKQIEKQEYNQTDMYQPPEMSPVVQQVQWAMQMEAKMKDIEACAENYLKEFEGSSELLALATQVAKELKDLYTQVYEDWCRDLQAEIKSGALQVSDSSPIVEFSGASQLLEMRVGGAAARRAGEARALAARGVPPPPPLAAALAKLQPLLKHLAHLRQIASFHNSVGERMVPCLRPALLPAALALSELARAPPPNAADTHRLAAYVADMQKAALTLDNQNAYLTSQHLAIRNIVASLIDTELLAKQLEWKKKVKEIRDIIEKVESNGYKNTEGWRTHWDWQLYKALECQYVNTLQSLHKHFPRVSVDLVLRGHRVRLQPPIEEIRAQHYHQLRRFISLPAQFVGLNADLAGTSIFSTIVDKHSHMGNKSISAIESTLSSLEATCDRWTRRAALACVSDLDQICRDNLKEAADWELNFKACKAYGQAVAKMTFEDEKVDWISVGTAGLRREFEAQVRNLWSCLISSLQNSCREDAAILDSFIANVDLTLENKTLPKNAKELSEISAKQQAIKTSMPEMEKLARSLSAKCEMGRAWGGEAGAGAALRAWQRAKQHLADNEHMFNHQAEIVKSSLSGDWSNLESNLESWLSRWTVSRARLTERTPSRQDELPMMKNRCRTIQENAEQWRQYVNEKDHILNESAKFGMNLEVSETWKEAEDVISEDEQLWSPFTQFEEDFSKLAVQEWSVFQKRLHLLDELISTWKSRLTSLALTPLTMYLQQELDHYTELTPILKYLRGADLTELHWREIFSLLEIKCARADLLTLGDLLDAAPNIKKHVKTLQKISASASSEAAIRGVLNDLELWLAGARLLITYRQTAKPVAIVGNIKETLSKLEEQQWAVGAAAAAGGGDACAGWELRLRTLDHLLRAMLRAQAR